MSKIQGKKKKETATDDSRAKTEEVKPRAEYTKAKKRLKRSIRTDEHKNVEDLQETVEIPASEGNVRKLNGTTNKVV